MMKINVLMTYPCMSNLSICTWEKALDQTNNLLCEVLQTTGVDPELCNPHLYINSENGDCRLNLDIPNSTGNVHQDVMHSVLVPINCSHEQDYVMNILRSHDKEARAMTLRVTNSCASNVDWKVLDSKKQVLASGTCSSKVNKLNIGANAAFLGFCDSRQQENGMQIFKLVTTHAKLFDNHVLELSKKAQSVLSCLGTKTPTLYTKDRIECSNTDLHRMMHEADKALDKVKDLLTACDTRERTKRLFYNTHFESAGAQTGFDENKSVVPFVGIDDPQTLETAANALQTALSTLNSACVCQDAREFTENYPTFNGIAKLYTDMNSMVSWRDVPEESSNIDNVVNARLVTKAIEHLENTAMHSMGVIVPADQGLFTYSSQEHQIEQIIANQLEGNNNMPLCMKTNTYVLEALQSIEAMKHGLASESIKICSKLPECRNKLIERLARTAVIKGAFVSQFPDTEFQTKTKDRRPAVYPEEIETLSDAGQRDRARAVHDMITHDARSHIISKALKEKCLKHLLNACSGNATAAQTNEFLDLLTPQRRKLASRALAPTSEASDAFMTFSDIKNEGSGYVCDERVRQELALMHAV